MATKKNPRVIKFILTDDDYIAFGRYRILYTEGGRKLVNRQRLTYLISGICIAGLFTIFHADHQFTMIAYAVAAVIGIGGPIFAERILLRQQDKAIKNSTDTIERVHAVENVITIGDDALVTDAGEEIAAKVHQHQRDDRARKKRQNDASGRSRPSEKCARHTEQLDVPCPDCTL